MSTFGQVYEGGNLLRAYRWVLSNPDPRYKNFFRAEYSAYALATDLNLRILRRQIKSGRFAPSHASKVYIPKASGLLRQISLLTVNDQIAYQACTNIIAEALQKRTIKRYGKTVFYHPVRLKELSLFLPQMGAKLRSIFEFRPRAFQKGIAVRSHLRLDRILRHH